MAEVVRRRPSLASPSGEARIRRGEAQTDIAKGRAVVVSPTAPSSARFESRVQLAPAGAEDRCFIALDDAKAGELVEFVVDGEVGGYAGLAQGTQLSVAANGVIDSTAPEGASRLVALNTTTIMLV